MKKIALISVLIFVPLLSFAAISVQKNSDGAILTTSSNVYQAGKSINVLEEKTGGFYVAGGSVSLAATLDKDAFIAGGSVNMACRIGGDAKIAGGNVNISGMIDGETMIVGGQVEIAPSAVIKGDFLAAAGVLDIKGSINGIAKIVAGQVYISGNLEKDASITAKKLIIESGAVINGNINYHGNQEVVVNDGAKVNGKINFTKIEVKNKMGMGGVIAFFTIAYLIKLLSMLVAALVLFFLLKRNIVKLSVEAVNNCWKELLRGFVLLITVPAASIILCVTIFGSMVGAVGMFSYTLLLILAAAFSGIVSAELLNRYVFRRSDKSLNWQMVVLGTIIFGLLILIPVLGWIVQFAIYLIALGAISKMLYDKVKTLAQ